MYPAIAYYMHRSRAYKKVPFGEIIELDLIESDDETITLDTSCSIEMVSMTCVPKNVILHFAITSIFIECYDTKLTFYESYIESSRPIVAIVNDAELKLYNNSHHNLKYAHDKIYVPFPEPDDDIKITLLGDSTSINFVDGLLDYKNISIKKTAQNIVNIGSSEPETVLYDIVLSQ